MKTKGYILICSLLSASVLALSQDNGRRWVYSPASRDMGRAFVVDTSFVEVYYAMNADDIKNRETYLDYQYLEIGKRYVKYSSEFMREAEEKQRVWVQEHPGAKSVPNVSPKSKLGIWSEYQYSEYFTHQGVLTEYSTMPMGLEKENAFHKETYPNQQWTVLSDTATVCNVRCQKALCQFSGREFVAWFANSIPLKYGPWKFGGLPGLILKVEDTGHLYSFECVKIERKKVKIVMHEYPGYREKKRSDILKLQRLANEDWFKLVGFINPKTGEVMSKYVPYNPLELK